MSVATGDTEVEHIELFAGCGGLCLGLSKAGFDLFLANELSPMAAETFAYNIIGENLAERSNDSQKTLWLSSNYNRSQINLRLREDPRGFPTDFKNTDLTGNIENIKGSLIVGNIIQLNEWLENNIEISNHIKRMNIDLVSGGPPCQSFSLAGLREKDNAKNHLPWEFARFVDITRPRCALLENVTGILRPFKDNGEQYYAWFEVAKAFSKVGYIPLPLHVNAKFAGVAQNRPRFLLIAIRYDEYIRLKNTFNDIEYKLFKTPECFYSKIINNQNVYLNDLYVHDLNTGDTEEKMLFTHSFLKHLYSHQKMFPSVREAIGDLSTSDTRRKSKYVSNINRLFGDIVKLPSNNITGHKFVSITPRVKRRFKIYQAAIRFGKAVQNEVSAVISGRSSTISDSAWNNLSTEKYIDYNGNYKSFSSKQEFVAYLKDHHSKKQTQKALLADIPAPAALSIPDDACHYSDIRTLTTREMARIQSFPDTFVFRSKTTTGGLNRRFEVPIYTQIGNAVPVLLAYAIGKSLKDLLIR